VLEGHHALTKLKALIGAKTGKDEKDTLRSFYAQDRCDNAFYVSESVEESIIDDEALFGYADTEINPQEFWEVTQKPVEEKPV